MFGNRSFQDFPCNPILRAKQTAESLSHQLGQSGETANLGSSGWGSASGLIDWRVKKSLEDIGHQRRWGRLCQDPSDLVQREGQHVNSCLATGISPFVLFFFFFFVWWMERNSVAFSRISSWEHHGDSENYLMMSRPLLFSCIYHGPASLRTDAD